MNLKEGGRKGRLSNSSKPLQTSSKASNIENKIDVRTKLVFIDEKYRPIYER